MRRPLRESTAKMKRPQFTTQTILGNLEDFGVKVMIRWMKAGFMFGFRAHYIQT